MDPEERVAWDKIWDWLVEVEGGACASVGAGIEKLSSWTCST